MRRLLAGATLVAAVAAPAAALAGSGGGRAVGIAEREFRISVYKPRLTPGKYRFNVTNFGEDAHNLVITGPGGFRSPATPDIRSRRRATLAVTLRAPGVYRLICTKPFHRSYGMKASIVVRR